MQFISSLVQLCTCHAPKSLTCQSPNYLTWSAGFCLALHSSQAIAVLARLCTLREISLWLLLPSVQETENYSCTSNKAASRVSLCWDSFHSRFLLPVRHQVGCIPIFSLSDIEISGEIGCWLRSRCACFWSNCGGCHDEYLIIVVSVLRWGDLIISHFLGGCDRFASADRITIFPCQSAALY